MRNLKGFAIIAVPLTIAIIGFLGTGALATLGLDKESARQRDQQRKADIQSVQLELSQYYVANKKFPLQKDESVDGWEALNLSLKQLPQDPLTDKGWTYSYWSDGKGYTIRYMQEENSEERVVFGY